MDERTTEILNRFNESWIEVENFFDDLIKNHAFEQLKPVMQFMQKLKQNGEHKHFRLGTSVHTLVISRSVDHGLRKDQKCIKIDSYGDQFEVIFVDGLVICRRYIVDTLDDVRVTKLLRTLKSTLID
jgi:hypothetical protein